MASGEVVNWLVCDRELFSVALIFGEELLFQIGSCHDLNVWYLEVASTHESFPQSYFDMTSFTYVSRWRSSWLWELPDKWYPKPHLLQVLGNCTREMKWIPMAIQMYTCVQWSAGNHGTVELGSKWARFLYGKISTSMTLLAALASLTRSV